MVFEVWPPVPHQRDWHARDVHVLTFDIVWKSRGSNRQRNRCLRLNTASTLYTVHCGLYCTWLVDLRVQDARNTVTRSHYTARQLATTFVVASPRHVSVVTRSAQPQACLIYWPFVVLPTWHRGMWNAGKRSKIVQSCRITCIGQNALYFCWWVCWRNYYFGHITVIMWHQCYRQPAKRLRQEKPGWSTITFFSHLPASKAGKYSLALKADDNIVI